MLDLAKTFPWNAELVLNVAEVPTTQYTLSGMAPPAKSTFEPTSEVSVLPIWNVHFAVAEPVSFIVPVKPADVAKQYVPGGNDLAGVDPS